MLYKEIEGSKFHIPFVHTDSNGTKSNIFLDQKYGLVLNGEPWVIQKRNKAVETCILSLKIIETIFSND